MSIDLNQPGWAVCDGHSNVFQEREIFKGFCSTHTSTHTRALTRACAHTHTHTTTHTQTLTTQTHPHTHMHFLHTRSCVHDIHEYDIQSYTDISAG